MYICSQQKLGYKQFNHFPPILQIEHSSKICVLEIKESKTKNKTKDSYLLAIKEIWNKRECLWPLSRNY